MLCMAKSTTEALYDSRFQTAYGALDSAFNWGEGMILLALETSDSENDIQNVGKNAGFPSSVWTDPISYRRV